ncbi:bifunctional DNA primase/polymerase [Pseudomonas tohonis]|nr:bifunctional DNA primase/polymerase [Pseudomonas tohonis]
MPLKLPASAAPISDWASHYITQYGLALVPIPPGKKGPTGDAWNQPGGYFTDAEEAKAFWLKNPKHNMGAVLGPGRVCSLDVDDVQWTRHVLYHELGLDLDAMALVFPTVVGNPARFRILFRMPAGLELAAHKLTWPNEKDPDGSLFRAATARVVAAKKAKDKVAEAAARALADPFKRFTVLELRAGLVQDVLPPSIHPETGNPYTWRTPPGDELPELTPELLAIWQNWDAFKRDAELSCPWRPEPKRPAKKAAPKRKPAAVGSGASVIEQFNQAHDVENLLEAHGYERKGSKYLCPHSSTGLPGITVKEGRMYSHHASDPLANGHQNDAFDVFCILEHNGDQGAAVKVAARILGIEHSSAPRQSEPPPLGDLPSVDENEGEPGQDDSLPRAPSGEAAEAEAAPPEGGAGGSGDPLKRLLQRYALVEGETKVYDRQKRLLMRKAAFESLVTKPLAKAWYETEEKMSIAADMAKRLVEQAELDSKGKRGKGKAGGRDMSPTERYVYIDGTQDIWDAQKRRRIPVAALRVALGDMYTLWLNSDERRVVDQEHLVFDPKMGKDPSVYINTFEGLPMTPTEDFTKCEAILEMVRFLVNGDEAVVHWLMCWLALPLQRVGSKMATAVLMHSTMEGSGKSLLLSDIVREIYGAYGATVGQTQLESQWSAWQSNKLYGVFEEVVSRDQRYNQVGKIKHMVTGKTMRIESKFISGWEEANYMNAVFLSNEIIPWPIAEDDRRLLVVWPELTLQGQLLDRVIAEMQGDGIPAFYGYLLQYEVGDFHAHTRPPHTAARQRLVDLSKTSWQSFLGELKAGYLGDLFKTCVSTDLYSLFIEWCTRNKEHTLSHKKFAEFIGTKIPKQQGVPWYDGKRRAFATFYFPVNTVDPSPPPSLESKALGLAVEAWRKSARMAGWKVDNWDHLKKEAA